MNTDSYRRILLTLLLLGLLLPAAGAQGALAGAAATGTITGTVDGSALQWNTLEIDVEGEKQNTATYNVMMDMFYNFSLQGHQDGRLIEGAVSIDFSSFSGPLVACPCEFTGDIMYWTTTAMFDDVYLANEAVITVLEAEELPNGGLRLVGTAEGQLDFHANLMSQEEPAGDPVAITLEFSIDKVTLVELDF